MAISPPPEALRRFSLLLAACAGLAVLYVWSPEDSPFFPRCVFLCITNLYCPGCGAQRALHELLHGRWIRAVDFNPLLVVSLPLIVYAFVSRALQHFGRSELPTPSVAPQAAWVVPTAIVLFWFLRNVPRYPFDLLAP